MEIYAITIENKNWDVQMKILTYTKMEYKKSVDKIIYLW